MLYLQALGIPLEQLPDPGRFDTTRIVYTNRTKGIYATGIFSGTASPLPPLEWTPAFGQQRRPGQRHLFAVREWGRACAKGLVLLSHASSASQDLGRPVEAPPGTQAVSLIISIFRFTATGRRITEGRVYFEVDLGDTFPAAAVQVSRFPDESAVGIPLLEDGGALTPCAPARPGCMGIASQRTSSFLLTQTLAVDQSPAPSPAGEPAGSGAWVWAVGGAGLIVAVLAGALYLWKWRRGAATAFPGAEAGGAPPKTLEEDLVDLGPDALWWSRPPQPNTCVTPDRDSLSRPRAGARVTPHPDDVAAQKMAPAALMLHPDVPGAPLCSESPQSLGAGGPEVLADMEFGLTRPNTLTSAVRSASPPPHARGPPDDRGRAQAPPNTWIAPGPFSRESSAPRMSAGSDPGSAPGTARARSPQSASGRAPSHDMSDPTPSLHRLPTSAQPSPRESLSLTRAGPGRSRNPLTPRRSSAETARSDRLSLDGPVGLRDLEVRVSADRPPARGRSRADSPPDRPGSPETLPQAKGPPTRTSDSGWSPETLPQARDRDAEAVAEAQDKQDANCPPDIGSDGSPSNNSSTGSSSGNRRSKSGSSSSSKAPGNGPPAHTSDSARRAQDSPVPIRQAPVLSGGGGPPVVPQTSP